MNTVSLRAPNIQAIPENYGRRISAFAIESRTVGAGPVLSFVEACAELSRSGLAVPKEGRSKQRPYKSTIRIQKRLPRSRITTLG